MSNEEILRLAIGLHTRTVVGLLDAVDRADTDAKRRERLDMIRDAVLEFKKDFCNATASTKS